MINTYGLEVYQKSSCLSSYRFRACKAGVIALVSVNYTANSFVEKIVVAFLQTDPTVTHEFFETCCNKNFLQAEKMLMIAVLDEATHCLREKALTGEGKTRERKGLSRDAEKWVLELDSDYLFSFENICEVLGLNPASVRQQLLRLQRR